MQPTRPTLMVAVAVVGAVVGQFAVELGAGKAPIPAGWEWTAPIPIAGLVTVVAYLPSPASRGRHSM